jgi:hypothetical protein
LADLEATATEYNPDGLPIAIEGLQMLASYLEVVDEGDDPGLRNFVRVLQRLVRANQAYEGSDRTKADFGLWAPSALEAVTELRRITAERLGRI